MARVEPARPLVLLADLEANPGDPPLPGDGDERSEKAAAHPTPAVGGVHGQVVDVEDPAPQKRPLLPGDEEPHGLRPLGDEDQGLGVREVGRQGPLWPGVGEAPPLDRRQGSEVGGRGASDAHLRPVTPASRTPRTGGR
ncbi:MAG: hypothetical protein NUV94_00015 [Candidatus Acetothermia bacterium]|nr:hypothetical protein [Candidatus Acetothermia bacterium]